MPFHHTFLSNEQYKLAPGVSSGVVSVSPEAFSPDDLAGLQMWYDAEFGVTLDEAEVIVWADKSSNGYDLDSGKVNSITVVSADVNGRDAIHFDDGNICLASAPSPFLQGKTGSVTFMVVKVPALSHFNDIVEYQNTDGSAAYRCAAANGTSVALFGRNQAGTLQAVGSFVYTGFNSTYVVLEYFADWTLGGNEFKIYANGTLIDEGSATGTAYSSAAGTSFCLGFPGGGAGSTDFNMAELLIYDSALSSEDRTSVREYLNDKYVLF
jgi:hypothetical protein